MRSAQVMPANRGKGETLATDETQIEHRFMSRKEREGGEGNFTSRALAAFARVENVFFVCVSSV